MLDAEVTVPTPQHVGGSTTRTVVLFVTVVSSGVLAGFFLTYGSTIMPGLATTEDLVFVEAFQGLERMFGTFEFGINWPVILGYLGGPVAMAAALALHRNSRPIVQCLLAAFLLTIVTVAITQIVHVPLNEAMTAAGDPTRTEAAQARSDFREDWWRAWNLARSASAVAAFACLCRALFLHGRTSASGSLRSSGR